MKIVIYGAGAIGGVVGGYLARSGLDVVLIGRQATVASVRENGLRLVTSAGTHVLPVKAVTSPTELNISSDDVVFLCMKGQSTTEALDDLSSAGRDIPIFSFQNGVRNEEKASKYFSRVYGVMVRVAATYSTDGEAIARWDPPGWLVMGRYPQGADEVVKSIGAKLRAAGFFVKITPDIMPYKWGKLLQNINDAVIAISSSPREELEPMLQAVQREAQEVLTKAGIHWTSLEQLAEEWEEIKIPLRKTMNIPARSSTWQSLSRGRSSIETDYFNGEIVNQARELGIRAPTNDAVLNMCHDMAANRDSPGKYSAEQLKLLLGMNG